MTYIECTWVFYLFRRFWVVQTNGPIGIFVKRKGDYLFRQKPFLVCKYLHEDIIKGSRELSYVPRNYVYILII